MRKEELAKPARPVSTAEERAQWISRFRSSGLTQVEFAQRNGLKVKTLQRWLYRQGRSQAPERKHPPTTFREVTVSPLLTGGGWAAEIRLPEGVVVRIAASAPPLWMTSLLKVVRQAC